MHKKLKYYPGIPVTLMMVFLAVVVGYATMWMFGYYTPTHMSASVILVQLVMIGLVASIAYAILKGLFHAMRMRDRNESELRLKDLPKDAEQPDRYIRRY